MNTGINKYVTQFTRKLVDESCMVDDELKGGEWILKKKIKK
jgi:hypothetical protein